jgi:peptidyl-prolyl cis-trans isomerase D
MVMRTMRNNIGILKWMFVLLLLVFGVGLVLQGNTGRRDLATAAAIVDGEPIDSQEYSRVLTQRLESERTRQGGDLSEAEANKVRRDTLNALIDEQLAVSKAKSLGQTMSAEEFREQLLNDPELKDDQGHFDQTRYQRVLDQEAQQGVTWQEAEQNFQRGMLLSKVQGFWACQSILSPVEARQAEDGYNRSVKAKALVWNLEKLRSKVQISDDDLHSYYSENKRRWAKPEQLKLRQILVRTDFAASSATAKAKADQLLAKIKAGADFKALAAADNADEAARKNSGDLGWVSPSDIRQGELASAVSPLKKGQVTGVVSTPDGFYILKAEDRKEGFEPTFANSSALAAKDLGSQRASKQASLLAYQALALLKQGKSPEEAARATQAELVESGWFGRDDAKALAALGDNKDFAEKMLDLKKGESLEAPVSGEKALVVAQLSDERPGRPPARPEDAAARATAAHDALRAAKGRALYDAWLAGLHSKADIVDQSGVLASK